MLLDNRFSLENSFDMLQICQFLILNAAPLEIVEHRMQAGETHISQSVMSELTVCVWVWEGEGVNKSMELFHFLGHIYLRTPLYLHTERFSLETEEEIRKLYFDDKIWKNNKGHIPVEIRVLKASFSKGRFWTVHCLSIQLIE